MKPGFARRDLLPAAEHLLDPCPVPLCSELLSIGNELALVRTLGSFLYVGKLFIRSLLSNPTLANNNIGLATYMLGLTTRLVLKPWGNHAHLQNLFSVAGHISYDRSVCRGKHLRLLREFHLLKINA